MSVPSVGRSARVFALAIPLALVVGLVGFARDASPELSPRFNHVMLYVSDLEASIEFYTAAFDVEVTQRLTSITVVAEDGTETTNPVRMAFLKFPGQEFVLELSEREVPDGGPSALFQHLGIDVADIDAAAERVLAAGALNFTGVRTVRATGGIEAKNAFFVGPDAEQLELMEMVAGTF